MQCVFLTVFRTHVHADIVSAYTKIFTNEQFLGDLTPLWAGLRTGLSGYTQIYLSLTSNEKQGKNNWGGSLDWIFAALNFMFESRRIVKWQILVWQMMHQASDIPIENTMGKARDQRPWGECLYIQLQIWNTHFLGSLRNCASLHWTAPEWVWI